MMATCPDLVWSHGTHVAYVSIMAGFSTSPLHILNLFGALTKSRLIPKSRKGWLKSTTCSRWKLIVRSAIAKSARCNYNISLHVKVVQPHLIYMLCAFSMTQEDFANIAPVDAVKFICAGTIATATVAVTA